MFDYDPGPINFNTSADLGQLPIGVSAPSDYGPALTTAGGSYAAMATLMASRQSAQLLRANAGIAGAQARGESEAGAEAAELYRTHLNATLGRQAASIGGANVTTSGSPLRALETTASLGARDIAQIQTNAARKAWGFQVTQAGDEVRAREAQSSGTMNAIGGLITTGARAYGQWSSD
jgi:hypothetical protein